VTQRPGPPGPPSSPGPLPAPHREWAYFLDIDGTLVDFTESPATLRLDAEVLQLMATLYELTGGALALISGRSLADIDRLLAGIRLPAAGQHGIERRSAAGRLRHPRVPVEPLRLGRALLEAAAAVRPGLNVEDKGLSLALHYRRAPRFAGYAHRVARAVMRQIGAPYTLLSGKWVVEIRPVGQDKGIAVLEFMRELPFRGRTPVFLGDDGTDEDGFATVNRLRGYSIKVGPGRTRARWRLRDVAAAKTWLRSISG